jgi:hypothetical protein
MKEEEIMELLQEYLKFLAESAECKNPFAQMLVIQLEMTKLFQKAFDKGVKIGIEKGQEKVRIMKSN